MNPSQLLAAWKFPSLQGMTDRSRHMANKRKDSEVSMISRPKSQSTRSSDSQCSPRATRSEQGLSSIVIGDDVQAEYQRTISHVEEDRNQNSATIVAKGALSSVCLCQPDPKIPRPRNGESFNIVNRL